MSASLPFNPALEALPVYQPGRPIEEVAREIGLPASDVIKLASNENPLGPSPAALAAMQEILPRLHLYPDGNAFFLKQRMAQKLGVEPANLIFGNGSNEIIEFVGHALMRPGVDIVVSQYCFAVYPIIAHLFGANLILVPSKKYGHDLPAMLNAITPRTSVIFVANPNNPTGTVAPPDDLKRLVAEIPDHVLLVMDEAYLEFLVEPVDFLPLIRGGKTRNLLLMRTFSKIFGLAGLRLGYGIGHPELIANLEKARQPFNVNALVQAAALAALDDQKHITRTRANNTAGLQFLQNSFRELRLEYIPSAANFVMVRVGDGKRVFQDLQKQGIIIRPMTSYQLPEWIRVSIGTPEEMHRFISALKKSWRLSENVGLTSCLPVRAASCRPKHGARTPREPAGWKPIGVKLRADVFAGLVFFFPLKRAWMEPLCIQSRCIGAEELKWIRRLISANPQWGRFRLSLHIAREWNWRNGAGQLKDMAARTLLVKLERRGLLQLPRRQRGGGSRPAQPPVSEQLGLWSEPLIEVSLSQVRPVSLEPVQSPVERGLLTKLLQQHHYLGYRRPVGENLQYLARDRAGRSLACLVFGAAAWKCAPRDQFIGWSQSGRERHLHLLANNMRFLVLSWVRVPHLASHLLGLVAARISRDWQCKYGHEICLLESFVERDRFRGSCYRAANWICVGQTQGRSRNDPERSLQVPCKDIYLYPLRRDWRNALQTEPSSPSGYESI